MSDQGPGDFQLVTTLKSSLAEARIVVLQSIEYKKKQDELNKEQAELNKKQAELNKAQDEFNKKQDGLNKGHADLHENNVTLISKLEESIKLASTFIAKRQQVLVWDMQDFCSTFQLPTKKKSFDPTLKDALAKLCEHGFMSENIGYTLVSILDAQTDEEALQNKSVCSSSAVLSSDKLQKCNEVRNIYDKSKSVLGLTELLFGCEINSVELQQRMDAIENRLHYSYIDSVDDLESVRSFLLDASSIMVHKFPGVNFCTIPKCEEPIPVGNWSAHLGIHDMAKKSVSPIKKSQLAKKRKLK
uniref:LisH domain-containing protein n=1 Tax=Meloidogyne hapla TaxID=6305 RepID=A0A1I8BHX6_MELHA